MPSFQNVSTPSGLKQLDNHFLRLSYVTGVNASQDDLQLLKAMTVIPKKETYPCLHRWFRHVMWFEDSESSNWPKGEGVTIDGVALPPICSGDKKSGSGPAGKPDDDDDDDFDPFAEETDADKDAKKQLAEKQKAAAPKAKKPVINRSTLVIDVKPCSTSTNLDEVEKLVRQIKLDGLEWSQASKRLPVAFGLMKLQIGCVIIDDLVDTDAIVDKIICVGLTDAEAEKKIKIRDGELEEEEEEIEGAEDKQVDEAEDDEEDLGLVQSAEIVSFNKL